MFNRWNWNNTKLIINNYIYVFQKEMDDELDHYKGSIIINSSKTKILKYQHSHNVCIYYMQSYIKF
jgi:hypothetical protein